MAGTSALCGPAVRAGNLQKRKQGSWAGLLGRGIGLDLNVWRWFPLFISVVWGYQAICDVLYQRWEGQGNRVVAAGDLVRVRITCKQWLSMQWVHLLRDSCSCTCYILPFYLNLAVWESFSPPNVPIVMKGDTQGRTQQPLWTNKLFSMHLLHVSCLLHILWNAMQLTELSST